MSEYSEHAAKLYLAASNMRCELHRTRSGFEADVVWYIRGDSAQELMEFTGGDVPPKYAEGRVETYTPEYLFRLSGARQAGVYTIADFEWCNTDEIADRNQTAQLVRIRLHAFAAFQIYDRTVEELISENSFRVLSEDPAGESGELLQVTFDLNSPSPREEFKSGVAVFDPALDWALRGYTIVTTGLDAPEPYENRYQADVVCRRWGAEQLVFPEAVEMRMESIFPGRESAPVVDSVRIHDVQFGVVKEDQFRLSAFGLPDHLIDFEQTTSPRRSWLPWLMALNAVLLIAAGWLFLRHRTRSSSP